MWSVEQHVVVCAMLPWTWVLRRDSPCQSTLVYGREVATEDLYHRVCGDSCDVAREDLEGRDYWTQKGQLHSE